MKQRPHWFIYLITNLVNGKYYVGLTKQTLKARLYGHASGVQHKAPRLRSAMKHHGANKFTIEPLAEADTLDLANKLETLWILALGSHLPDVGYNISLGGGSAITMPETRRRQSEAASRRRHTPETREKISAVQKGKKLSLRQRQPLSDYLKAHPIYLHAVTSNTGRKMSLEAVEKSAGKRRGQKRTAEQRRRISEATRAAIFHKKTVKLLEAQIARMDWKEKLIDVAA